MTTTTRTALGTLTILAGLAGTATAATPPPARPAPIRPTPIQPVSPVTQNRRPGYIDTSWQNDPVTWYRIQHHGQYPPWYRPYPPYPVPYPVPVVISQPVAVPVSAPITEPAPQAASKIRVTLPEAKAEVAIDGKIIPGLGSKRWLNTPPQAWGESVTYTVTATWLADGTPVTQERAVTVVGGQYGFVDFTRPAAAN